MFCIGYDACAIQEAFMADELCCGSTELLQDKVSGIITTVEALTSK